MKLWSALPAIRNLIREDKIAQMYSVIQTGAAHGMQTMDQCLINLVNRGLITKQDALAKAQDKNSFMAWAMGRMEVTAMVQLTTIVEKMVAANASDLFVTAGLPLSAKINGEYCSR